MPKGIEPATYEQADEHDGDEDLIRGHAVRYLRDAGRRRLLVAGI